MKASTYTSSAGSEITCTKCAAWVTPGKSYGWGSHVGKPLQSNEGGQGCHLFQEERILYVYPGWAVCDDHFKYCNGFESKEIWTALGNKWKSSDLIIYFGSSPSDVSFSSRKKWRGARGLSISNMYMLWEQVNSIRGTWVITKAWNIEVKTSTQPWEAPQTPVGTPWQACSLPPSFK